MFFIFVIFVVESLIKFLSITTLKIGNRAQNYFEFNIGVFIHLNHLYGNYKFKFGFEFGIRI